MLSPEPSLSEIPALRIERAAPASAQAYAALRRAVISLRLRPGQPLSEQGIARQLGISRTPVREAFIKLAEAGLFEVLPQRGTLVRKISLKAVKDARFAREAIELAVLREAIGCLTPDVAAAMRALVAEQRAAAASDDLERFMTLDDAFHRAFALVTDHVHAWTVIEAQKAQMDRVRYLSLPAVTPIDRLIDQHEAILEAALRGDAVAAAAALREHLAEVLAILDPLRRLHPDLFEAEPG